MPPSLHLLSYCTDGKVHRWKAEAKSGFGRISEEVNVIMTMSQKNTGILLCPVNAEGPFDIVVPCERVAVDALKECKFQ
jgi:hypothetical protein